MPPLVTRRLRRDFLIAAASGAACLALPSQLLGAPAARRSLLVSPEGGDRASGYVMSNKIVRRGERLICTWLDAQRQNRWAEVDLRRGQVVRAGVVDEPRKDNHCGVALATDVDGTLHALVGAHHASFIHYRMPADKPNWERVEDGRAVGVTGTYPSLVCDGKGTLHVTYRRENNGADAHLMYCRRPKGGPWSPPRALVRSAVHEHSWLTNAVEVAASGRLHVVISNTLPTPSLGRDARYFGASHLYCDDAGETWRQFGDKAALPVAADAAQLKRIESAETPPERIEARYGGPRGPLHSYYHKMALSNPVVDDGGRPWVIVHNGLTGGAELFRYEENAGWIGVPLLDAVQAVAPGRRIRHCGQLGRCRDGAVEAVLTVSPEAGKGWGDVGSSLVRLRFDAAGRITERGLVRPPQPGVPDWLPSLERFAPHAPTDAPALLYTSGLNAGGYDNNVNSVKTEVWLDWR